METFRRPPTWLLLVALVTWVAFGARSADEQTTARSQTVSLQSFRDGIRSAGLWEGGKPEHFESVGRNSLASAIRNGLNPEDKLLDIGAGALRVGWWFLQYLDASNYHAIEPNRGRVDTAAGLIGAKFAIYYNADFDFPNERFDFVFARSIWTHASKAMISKMLSEFVENSTDDARFLTSVQLARNKAEDYMGDAWVGRVDKSDSSGVVRHSLHWIQKEANKYGLTARERGALHGQVWLLIERRSPTN